MILFKTLEWLPTACQIRCNLCTQAFETLHYLIPSLSSPGLRTPAQPGISLLMSALNNFLLLLSSPLLTSLLHLPYQNSNQPPELSFK